MALTINSVVVNPAALNAGQTEIEVTVQVTSDMAVSNVMATPLDPTGRGVGTVPLGRLAESMPPQYTFRGVVTIPLTINDGTYPISVTAQDDGGSAVINNTTKFIVARGSTSPQPPEPNENDKCCCKVSLNITAGPVNIYVCGPDSKFLHQVRLS